MTPVTPVLPLVTASPAVRVLAHWSWKAVIPGKAAGASD
jgi:hypothetical protein